MNDAELQRRWRLVLGRDGQMSTALDGRDEQRDAALEYLYEHEYAQRMHAPHVQPQDERGAGSERSQPGAVRWLAQVRRLFPQSTVEHLQRQALERYQLTELLRDVQVLRQATPSLGLVQTLLSFRHSLPAALMAEVRRIIAVVCTELDQRLARQVRSRIEGRRVRQAQGGRPSHAALDWSLTLRRNLRHFDPQGEEMLLERLYYNPQRQRQLPWEIIVLIDQSGSMSASVIHAAVMAGIFCRVRSLQTRVLLFDTQVVELDGRVADPVETLLAVQLGGGTDIGQAMQHAERLISQPGRSMLVLISDFHEGGEPAALLDCTRRLRDSGVSLLGLAALDEQAHPDYDKSMAQALVQCGMPVAAMTPEHLADWVGACMSAGAR